MTSSRTTPFRALALVLVIFAQAGGAAHARTLAPIAVDPVTGFALGGYDPAAYIVEGRARVGRPGIEARWGGLTWTFANEGNRAVFLAAPHLFVPGFDGYSPLSIAQGVPGLGDPRLWAVRQGQLYLFRSSEHLAEFQRDSQAILARAEALWPQIAEALTYRDVAAAASTARSASPRLAAATKGSLQ